MLCRGAAAHGDVAVGHLDRVDARPGRSVERALAQGVEHRGLRLLPGANPRPRETAVVAGVMRVVGRERVEAPAALERFVPVQRGVAAAELELAAGVPDLDPEQALARLPLVGPQAAPVGVGEDTARRRSRAPRRRPPAAGANSSSGMTGSISRPRASTWASSSRAGAIAFSSADGMTSRLGGGRLIGADPVVGDRQNVIPRPFVVPRRATPGPGRRRSSSYGCEGHNGAIPRARRTGSHGRAYSFERAARSGDIPMTIW